MTIISLTTQISFWVLAVLMMPMFEYMQSQSVKLSFMMVPASIKMILPWMIPYFVNYVYLVPEFFFQKRRKWIFYLGNIVMLLMNIGRLVIHGMRADMPEDIPFSKGMVMSMGTCAFIFLHICIVMLATGFCYIERYYKLKESSAKQKQKAAEAELVWLKNQLNPHFLFNTLNNISSLTQIDADKAQESIGQLSDLLRYALYESDADMVDLSKELEFMDNYIDLMSLRCNEMTMVTKDFRLPEKEVKIAPLLFISLIENAFKHGVNARNESFVKISLHQDGHDLCFCCENSVFEKQKVDRVGSGIGLSNLKKRLDLIYPGRYKYTSGEKDGLYFSIIILKGVC